MTSLWQRLLSFFCIRDSADDDEQPYPVFERQPGEHLWGGWPGNTCLDCGLRDRLEECVAVHNDGVYCVEGHILCGQHPRRECPEHANPPCPRYGEPK